MIIKSKGYTLIEVLVVISILGIIFSIGFSGFREFSRRQELTGSVKKITADLRLTQQLALTGQKPTGLTCERLDSYTFTRVTSSVYTITANCINSTNHVVKTVTLPEQVSLSEGTVVYKALGHGTTLNSPIIFTVANTTSGTSGTITVGIGGSVE